MTESGCARRAQKGETGKHVLLHDGTMTTAVSALDHAPGMSMLAACPVYEPRLIESLTVHGDAVDAPTQLCSTSGFIALSSRAACDP